MKTIETAFRDKGWDHLQLKREGDWAIYQRSKEGGLGPHFEVVRIKWRKVSFIAGKEIAAGEVYPSASRWGVDGFTFRDFAKAENRYGQMVAASRGAGISTGTDSEG